MLYMNKFLLLVEQILTESDLMTGIIHRNYSRGGLPDMSGPKDDSWGIGAWDTKPNYKKAAMKAYAVTVDSDKKPAMRRVFFVKAPSTMKEEDFQAKLDIFLAQQNISETPEKVERIDNRIVHRIDKPQVTNKEWWQICGRNPEEETVKINKPGTKFETREEGMAKIKEKAMELAKEKYRVLVSNGVSKEDAKGAAKKAYDMFIKDFYSKSNLKVAPSSGPVKAIEHPLMKQNVREMINSQREREAKEKAIQRYKELISQGKDEAYAKSEGRKLFAKLTGK